MDAESTPNSQPLSAKDIAMSKLTASLTLVTAALLSAGTAFAAEPAEKTREQVIAELQQARASGEVAAISADQAGVGALNNGLAVGADLQLAKKKTAAPAAAKAPQAKPVSVSAAK